MQVTFEDWTKSRIVSSLGTNAGATKLPFQSWRHFKEAFAPELIDRAINSSQIPVKTCFDPFGGSGTTALACQFLGVSPIIAEVNPFLADLIESKLVIYDSDSLAKDLSRLLLFVNQNNINAKEYFSDLPPTFIEPGIKNRWIFDELIATRLAAYLSGIAELTNPDHQRLFKILLGGILIDVSNVVINGKGRRYRKNWEANIKSGFEVDELFCKAAQQAILEIHKYARRLNKGYMLLRGDSRTILSDEISYDISIFSPPYPNSFDYTDVYNIELWVLGYLNDSESNRSLRESTLCSHVQVAREFPIAPKGSPILDETISKLIARKDELWDKRIPAMIGGYFADMLTILNKVWASLSSGGSAWLVVGDSRYVSVYVDTALILSELAANTGWIVKKVEPFRSMRASPQQGGREELAESLIVLVKPML